MNIACLCPTYRRPRLLENAIACYLAQDYPAAKRRLFVLDDSGEIKPHEPAPGVAVLSVHARFPSLPEKYEAVAYIARQTWAECDTYAIWEDDDIYLPWHLSAHAAALGRAAWSKPTKILSLYSGSLDWEPSAGRFFASIAFRRSMFQAVDGFVQTKRADFDQQFLARLSEYSPPADPLEDYAVPGYIFRWGSTDAYHGQGQMRAPEDETWYDRCAKMADPQPREVLVPMMDEETANVCGMFTVEEAASL